MPRIRPVDRTTADPNTRDLLDSVESKLGAVPNLIATMAHSRPVAEMFLEMSRLLAGGSLSARQREQLALRIAEVNQCGYCVAAHTALGKGAGLTERETIDARSGASRGDKERIALAFAARVVETRGAIDDDDFALVRDAGFDDGEIAEIVAHVALNTLTNYLNLVAATEIDFPVAPPLTDQAA